MRTLCPTAMAFDSFVRRVAASERFRGGGFHLCLVRSLFFKKEMELSLVGLQNAGKTSLVNVVATGGFQQDMIPTVGFNMRKVSKGSVTIKLWDLGGQVKRNTTSVWATCSFKL